MTQTCAAPLRRPRSSAKPFLWIAGVVWALPALLVILGYIALPHDNPNGQCEGIGWGCSLSPADVVLWGGMLAAVPLLVAGLAGMLIVVVYRALGLRRQAELRPLSPR